MHILSGDFAGFPGCGLLRLHSTYRHDLKIYASDEGRVQMTAAAFAKVGGYEGKYIMFTNHRFYIKLLECNGKAKACKPITFQ